MTLYTAWANSTNTQQASIARGENIFNNSPMKHHQRQRPARASERVLGTCLLQLLP